MIEVDLKNFSISRTILVFTALTLFTSSILFGAQQIRNHYKMKDVTVTPAYMKLGENSTHTLWGRCPGNNATLSDVNQSTIKSDRIQKNCDFMLEKKVDLRRADTYGV